MLKQQQMEDFKIEKKNVCEKFINFNMRREIVKKMIKNSKIVN